jgi:hypothetical protein
VITPPLSMPAALASIAETPAYVSPVAGHKTFEPSAPPGIGHRRVTLPLRLRHGGSPDADQRGVRRSRQARGVGTRAGYGRRVGCWGRKRRLSPTPKSIETRDVSFDSHCVHLPVPASRSAELVVSELATNAARPTSSPLGPAKRADRRVRRTTEVPTPRTPLPLTHRIGMICCR